MTARLKHKLELEQINVKSSYLNESFVQIGTPLPALANAKKDQLEYVPEWQQEVSLTEPMDPLPSAGPFMETGTGVRGDIC